MNYRADVAAVRTARDGAIVRAQTAGRRGQGIVQLRLVAARMLDELAAARDREIRRLADEGLRPGEIASAVGCSPGMVYEIVNPDRRAAYNRRRRKYQREHRQLAPSGARDA